MDDHDDDDDSAAPEIMDPLELDVMQEAEMDSGLPSSTRKYFTQCTDSREAFVTASSDSIQGMFRNQNDILACFRFVGLFFLYSGWIVLKSYVSCDFVRFVLHCE